MSKQQNQTREGQDTSKKKLSKKPAWSMRLESGYKGIRSGWMSTSRTMIEEFLARSPEYQRPTRPARVKAYARMMRADNWFPEAGMPFQFCDLGFMIQGHHRSLAMLDAGVFPKVFVQYGIPDGKKIYLLGDDGNPKTFQEVLKAQGAKHYSPLAPAVKQVLAYEQGKPVGCTASAMIIEAYDFYLAEQDAFNFWIAQNQELNGLVGPSYRCGINVLLEVYGGYDRDEICQFWKEVGDEVGQQAALTLRRMLRINANKTRSRGKYTRSERYKVCISAFRAWHAGKESKSFNLSIPFKRFEG